MKVAETPLKDVLVIEPSVYRDERGFFLESFNAAKFREATGIDAEFVQDNHSRSQKNVLRGLHYQIQQAQGKLVRVVSGCAFDVAVDLRRFSPTFGQWYGVQLSDQNHRQFWVPPGFAHGFLVLVDGTDFVYKTTDYYAPEHERVIRWDDPRIAIDWPLDGLPLISQKDQAAVSFADAEYFG